MDILLTLLAIMYVESRFDPLACNKKEDARGILQIRQIKVDEVNRILELQHSITRYSHDDAYCPGKSIQMFHIYTSYWNAEYTQRTGYQATPEVMARNWNAGGSGYKQDSTLKYWNTVSNALTYIQTWKTPPAR